MEELFLALAGIIIGAFVVLFVVGAVVGIGQEILRPSNRKLFRKGW